MARNYLFMNRRAAMVAAEANARLEIAAVSFL
jgi:hypothetical protein